jgi:hypothetical protein
VRIKNMAETRKPSQETTQVEAPKPELVRGSTLSILTHRDTRSGIYPYPTCEGNEAIIIRVEHHSLAGKTIVEACCTTCRCERWFEPVSGEPTKSPMELTRDFQDELQKGYQALRRVQQSSLRPPSERDMGIIIGGTNGMRHIDEPYDDY